MSTDRPMPWPHPPDYNEAVQVPQQSFQDAELRLGSPALNALGLPWPRSGSSADVYKIVCPGEQAWAVKCFTRAVHGLRERYQVVSDFLARRRMPFLVEVHYLEQGIRVHGHWFPIVKMRWVDGLQLNGLAGEYADKPAVLERLAFMWVRLAQEMRKKRIVHGDLQHGNVLLVPEDREGHLRLRLVDYDGLTVPGLEASPSGELGHPNYQHPQRRGEGDGGAEADRFAHLVIYTGLRALAVGGRALWQRFDNSENLLFRETDFQKPAESSLFQALLELPDADVRALVGHLVLAADGPLGQTPLLDELLTENGHVLPLKGRQERGVARTLSGNGKATMVGLASVPPVLADEPPPAVPSPPPPQSRVRSWKQRIQTHWSTGTMLTGAGALTVLLLAALLFRVVGLSAGQASVDSNETAPVAGPAQPAELPAPTLSMPASVIIRPGQQQQVRLAIDRQGQQGDVSLQVDGLPDGLRYDYAVPVDEPGTVVLKLSAAPTAAVATSTVHVQASVGAAKTDRQLLTIAVQPLYVPRLIAFPDVALKPGDQQTVKVAVNDLDPQAPVKLELDGLPAGVTWRVTQASAEADRYLLSVTFQAPGNAEPSVTSARAVAVVGEESTNRQTFSVTILSAAPVGLDRPGVEKVAFHSADGVTLVGTWYPGLKGHESPCALLLHDCRESRRAPAWDALARALQDKGFAVLAFDFRGHGDSISVAREFWDDPTNRVLVRYRKGDTISVKDFDPRYWPVLVNDIAAARMFLDEKNDLKECNASRVLLVGAHEGAALGMFWLCAEWSRFEVAPGALTRLPEGRTVTGAVWLSLGPTLAGRGSKVDSCLQAVAGDRKVPIALIHGDADPDSGEFAQQMMRELRKNHGNLRGTGARIIPNTANVGYQLLQTGPAVGTILLQQALTFDGESTARWTARESDKKSFLWQVPRSTMPLKAKGASDKTLGMYPLIPLGLAQ